MTVFKAFLKVLNKNKFTVLLQVIILVFFGGFSLASNESTTNFEAVKPNVAIVDEDNSKISKAITEYFDENANILTPESLEDALFYREIGLIINIPKNYGVDFMTGKNPEIEIKSAGTYQSSLASMLLEKYVNTLSGYRSDSISEERTIELTNSTLKNDLQVELTSKRDTSSLDKASTYYNFANYTILSGSIMIISLVLTSFRSETIRKRTTISGMDYRKYNRILFLSNSLFSLMLWIFYVILSFVIVGDIMATKYGLLYILNSFIFSLVALAIAILVSNIVNKKEAINGIVNVIALGSSFLCGAFVPMEWLPNEVLTVSHILPSYWYIKSNEIIKTLEVLSFDTLKPVFINMLIMLGFVFIFVVLSNIVSRAKRKLD